MGKDLAKPQESYKVAGCESAREGRVVTEYYEKLASYDGCAWVSFMSLQNNIAT